MSVQRCWNILFVHLRSGSGLTAHTAAAHDCCHQGLGHLCLLKDPRFLARPCAMLVGHAAGSPQVSCPSGLLVHLLLLHLVSSFCVPYLERLLQLLVSARAEPVACVIEDSVACKAGGAATNQQANCCCHQHCLRLTAAHAVGLFC